LAAVASVCGAGTFGSRKIRVKPEALRWPRTKRGIASFKAGDLSHPQRHDIETGLRAGIPYRDIARRHNISKHALSRHRLNHSLHNATALATTMKIKPLLDKAETAPTLNSTLLAIREARRCLEELVMLLNSTVPSLPE
jgi:transposase-like protein